MEMYNRFFKIEEDKKSREERREKRREERRKEGFDSPDADFNLKSFIKSLNALKNSILGKLAECGNRMQSKTIGGEKTSEKYEKIFNDHLTRVSILLGQAQAKKDSGEGRKLERGLENDQAAIENFRDNYKDLSEDFKKASENYDKEAEEEAKKKSRRIEYKKILDPLDSAAKSFEEAKKMLSDIETGLNRSVYDGGKKSGSSDENKKSSIKLEKEIKPGVEPKDEKDKETIKKVYALICEKWKDSKKLTSYEQWKKSIFCNPKEGTLIIGPNRTACIRGIKKAYGLPSEDAKITQEFIDKLEASEVIKESISIKNEGKLLSFNSFLTERSKMNEGVDMDALSKFMDSLGSKESKGGESKDKSEELPFKGKEDGDKFRKWVNDNHSDWAKENKLDSSGSHTNSFIRKAWDKFKDEYKKEDESKSSSNYEKLKSNLGSTFQKVKDKEAISLVFNDKKNTVLFYGNNRFFIGANPYKGYTIKGSYSEGGKKLSIDKGKTIEGGSIFKNLRKALEKEKSPTPNKGKGSSIDRSTDPGKI